ncbi:MAG: hypothetical protein V1816_25465 [Pseudomonadota bacterium]
MKKAFIVVLSALLVLAFTLPVMAETAVKFKGSHRVRYWYLNNLNLAHKQKQENKQTYFDHRFRLSFSFHPSEVLSMNVSTQANENQKWGNQRSNMQWSGKADAITNTPAVAPNGGVYIQRTVNNNKIWDNGIEVYRTYMTIVSPYGKFDVGRMSGGEAGLTVFGYYGGPFHEDQAPFCSEGPRDRIKYTFKAGNFVVVGLFEKYAEIDANNGTYDSDSDAYHIIPVFTFGGEGFKGAVNCLFSYVHDRTGALAFGSNFSNDPVAVGPAYNAAGLAPIAASATSRVTGIVAINGGGYDLYSFLPAAQFEFGPFAIRTTFRYVTGTYTPSDAAGSSYKKIQLSGFGFYADTTYTYGGGMAGLAYFYLQGDETEKNKQFTPFSTATQSRTKAINNMVTSGGDYCPLLISYDVGLEGANVYNQPNHQSIVAWWDHSLTEELMVHAAYGYMHVNNVPKHYKHDFGHEVNAGLKASIYGNVELSTRFGYFIAGKYQRGSEGQYVNGVKVNSNWDRKINNGWAWKNELVINF